MTPRRRSRRMLLGSTLGLAIGVTLGCIQDDDFVSEYAAEVCRMVRECGRELRLPGTSETDDVLPDTDECEILVEARYSSCAGRCDFHRGKARRCLRRLRNNECATKDPAANPQKVAGDESIPIVCDGVFDQCEGGTDENDQCSAPTGCSVAGRAGEGLLSLPLVGLVVLGLRRRRP